MQMYEVARPPKVETFLVDITDKARQCGMHSVPFLSRGERGWEKLSMPSWGCVEYIKRDCTGMESVLYNRRELISNSVALRAYPKKEHTESQHFFREFICVC